MIDWFEYGEVIERNDDDTMRKYFIIECMDYFFKRYMFKHGWVVVSNTACMRKGLSGAEITVERND